MTVDDAIDVFIEATAAMRSLHYPCLGERRGPIWFYRDAEREVGDYRLEEYVAYGIDPGEVVSFATQETRGKYAICHLLRSGENGLPVRKRFKELRYRLKTTEPFFVHNLTKFPASECPYYVGRITTQEDADLLTTAAGRPRFQPQILTDDPPPFRQYWALDDGQPIGWVRSVRAGRANWCSSLWVSPKYRRRGIGRALMSKMLAGDRESGSIGSVLLSTRSGAKLYPSLGYEQIGELLVYTPYSVCLTQPNAEITV